MHPRVGTDHAPPSALYLFLEFEPCIIYHHGGGIALIRATLFVFCAGNSARQGGRAQVLAGTACIELRSWKGTT